MSEPITHDEVERLARFCDAFGIAELVEAAAALRSLWARTEQKQSGDARDFAGRQNFPDEPYKNTDPYTGLPIEAVRATMTNAEIEKALSEGRAFVADPDAYMLAWLQRRIADPASEEPTIVERLVAALESCSRKQSGETAQPEAGRVVDRLPECRNERFHWRDGDCGTCDGCLSRSPASTQEETAQPESGTQCGGLLYVGDKRIRCTLPLRHKEYCYFPNYTTPEGNLSLIPLDAAQPE